MSVVLLTSIFIRITAMFWSMLLARRVRDWRMLFLTAMLALMAVRQSLTLITAPPLTDGESAALSNWFTELPGLVVSLMALLAVIFLERMLLRQQRTDAAHRRFEELLEATPDFVGMSNRSGKVLYVNPAGRRQMGIDPESDVTTLTIADFHPESEHDRLVRQILPTTLEDGVWSGETRFRHSDGTDSLSSQVVLAHRDNGGNVQFISTIARDVSEQKLAAKALRESEQRYRSVVEGQTEFIVRWLPDGIRTFVNEAYCRYFGISRSECIGTSFMSLIDEADRELVLNKIRSLRPESPVATAEHRVLCPDGTIGWQMWTDRATFDDDGRVIEYQSIGRDITKRKEAEARLRESEQLFRDAFENAPIGMALVGLDGRILDANQRLSGMLGYSRDELLRHAMDDITHPDDRGQSRELNEMGQRGEATILELEKRYLHRDGSTIWAHATASLQRDGDGRPCSYITQIQDITQRQRAEVTLSESEERFRRVAENVPGVVYSYEYRAGQPRSRNYLGPGLDELIGPVSAAAVEERFDVLFDLVHPEDIEPLSEAVLAGLESGRSVDHECRLRHDSGGYIWVRSMARGTRLADGANRWHVVLLDITERKKSDAAQNERLERARRMESTVAMLASATDSSELSLEQAIQRITDAAARAIGVARVGVWMLGDDREELRCLDLLDRRTNSHESGMVLRASDYPAFFEALASGRAFDARDARNDPRTREFLESHLEPLGIVSMLGAAIRRSGRIVGLICHGQVDQMRTWTTDEITFAVEMADQVAQALLSDDQRRSEAALRESEERYRTLVAHAPEAIVVLDVETMRLVDANENAERLFKYKREELLQCSPEDLSPPRQPDGRPSGPVVEEVVNATLAGQTPVLEYTHRDREGRDIPTEVRLVRLPTSRGNLVRGSITDITERKQAEQRQKMMVNELDHRVKNNLAAVMALARHSASSATSLSEFSEAFMGRIAAMARTHESLARARWEGIGLDQAVRLTLDAYMHGDRPRVRVCGPEIELDPKAAMPLCMTLHELVTNAAKHGSLSNDEGLVALEWSRADNGHVRVAWTESGGPPVTPPDRAGVGASLIEGFISYELHGDLNVDYRPEGLRCEMTIPVAL